jgi:hypothetical protein
MKLSAVLSLSVLLFLLTGCIGIEVPVSAPPVGVTPTDTPAPPAATATAGVKPTAIPEPSATTPPASARGLLFLRDGALMLWDPQTGEAETLVGPAAEPPEGTTGLWPGAVASFALSADRRTVVLVRLTDQRGTDELVALDLATRELRLIRALPDPGIAELMQYAVSADGEWLAYVENGALPAQPRGGRPAPIARPALGSGPRWGALFIVPVRAAGEPVEIGFCGPADPDEFDGLCGGLQWSPDGQALAWHDARGVWLARRGADTPVQLIAQEERTFYFIAQNGWSPSGQALLVGAAVPFSEGFYGYRVLDVAGGRLAELPEVGMQVRPAWLRSAEAAGDRLFLIAGLSGEIWRVDPASATIVERESSFALTGDNSITPAYAAVLADGRLAYALLGDEATPDDVRGLYVADPATLEPRRLNGLPPAVHGEYMGLLDQTVSWAPDGSALAFDYQVERTIVYVPADGSAAVDVRAVLGDQFGDRAAWVP